MALPNGLAGLTRATFQATPIDLEESRFPELRDKVALVTGASSGFGLALSRLLYKAGVKLILCDVAPLPATAPELSSSHSVVFQTCDITNFKALQELFRLPAKHFGALNMCFAVAGIHERGGETYFPDPNGEEPAEEPTQLVHDVNLKAQQNIVLLGNYHMAKTGGGSMVLMSSMASLRGTPTLPLYSASKHGLLGFCRALSIMPPEYRRNNAISWVCPSSSLTGLLNLPPAVVIALANYIKTAGLTINEADRVATAAMYLASLGGEANGMGLAVIANQATNVEQSLDYLLEQWLGIDSWANLLKEVEAGLFTGEAVQYARSQVAAAEAEAAKNAE